MGQEIEYRYLLKTRPDTGAVKPNHIMQGYLCTHPGCVVRVRVLGGAKGDKGFLTIKGEKIGATAPEFEYEIPADDAKAILTLCGDNALTKDRYGLIGPDGMLWDVDIFTGRHEGLMIAEIELPLDGDPYVIPDWLDGIDVTEDRRLGNASLVVIDDAELRGVLELYGVKG